MRAQRLLLAAAACPLVLACSTASEDAGNAAGAAGQAPSSVAGASGSVGTAGSAGSASVTAGANSGGAGNGTSGANTAGATTAGSPSIGGAGANTAGSSSGGAAAGSAGAAGSSSGGAGGVGGAAASGCAGVTNAKFCADWDKLGVGKPSGDFTVSDGVVVDSTKAFSGAQALHFQKLAKPAGGTPNIRFSKQFPLASNDMHGRVMVFLAQTPKTDSHWNFITSSNSGGTEWSIGGQYGKFELVCDPPDHGLDSDTAFPGGKWVCLQWEFKAPKTGDTTFVTKVDGVAVNQGEFTGANSKGEKWAAGTWNNLKLGWEVFGSSDVDVEFWLDDLAFGEQPIACPNK